MDKVRLALVGCGGMGTRHMGGLNELSNTPFSNVEVVALCDINHDNAELAAREVEKMMGFKPDVFTDLETMSSSVSDLHAVDVVVDPCFHEQVVCQALELGLHVMVEKPMAITVKGCLNMMESAERNKRLLSIAENFRRDPSARLVNHLLKKGIIGNPYLATFHQLSGGDAVFITPWRHLKDRGGMVLDMGVHYTDMIRYQLGDIDEVYGDVRLVESVRKKPLSTGHHNEFYRLRHEAMMDEYPATAEDVSVASMRLKSGIVVNWIVGIGGNGGCGGEMIFGDKGCLSGFGTRGGSTTLKRTGQDDVSYEELTNSADDFELEPLAAHFFPDKMTGDNIDFRLLALEYREFAEAILNGRNLEVDGVEGMKDVAAIYAIFESSIAGRAVKMSEVESGELYTYQEGIESALTKN